MQRRGLGNHSSSQQPCQQEGGLRQEGGKSLHSPAVPPALPSTGIRLRPQGIPERILPLPHPSAASGENLLPRPSLHCVFLPHAPPGIPSQGQSHTQRHSTFLAQIFINLAPSFHSTLVSTHFIPVTSFPRCLRGPCLPIQLLPWQPPSNLWLTALRIGTVGLLWARHCSSLWNELVSKTEVLVHTHLPLQEEATNNRCNK